MTSTWDELRFYGQLASSWLSPSYDLRKIPGPPGLWGLGHIPKIMRPDYNVQVLEWADEYGGIFKFSLGCQWVVVVSDPALASQVLGRGAANVPRKSVGYQFFDLATNHLNARSFFTTTEEAQWAAVRKATAPAFSTANVRRSFGHVLKHAEGIADALSQPQHDHHHQDLSTLQPHQEVGHLQAAQQPSSTSTGTGRRAGLLSWLTRRRLTSRDSAAAEDTAGSSDVRQGPAFAASPAGVLVNDDASSSPEVVVTPTKKQTSTPSAMGSPASSSTSSSFSSTASPLSSPAGSPTHRSADPAAASKEAAAASESGQIVDMQHHLELALLNVFVEALFDVDAAEFPGSAVADAMNLVLEEANQRLKVPLRSLASWLTDPEGYKRFQDSQRLLGDTYGYLADLLRARGPPADSETNLWACLARVKHHKTGAPLTREQLIPEIGAFMMAGFDTSSHTVAWTLYALATNPEAQARARQELAARGLLHGQAGVTPRAPTFEDLSQLPFLNCVIDEAMRMYPVAATASVREVVKPTRVGDYTIPRGVIVWPMVYALHNTRHNWDQPDKFKPERWYAKHGLTADSTADSSTISSRSDASDEEDSQQQQQDNGRTSSSGSSTSSGGVRGRSPPAFLPFSDGIKNCLGQSLGLMEVRTVLAVLLSRYHFELAPCMLDANQGGKVSMIMSLTLKMKGGLHLRCIPLESAAAAPHTGSAAATAAKPTMTAAAGPTSLPPYGSAAAQQMRGAATNTAPSSAVDDGEDSDASAEVGSDVEIDSLHSSITPGKEEMLVHVQPQQLQQPGAVMAVKDLLHIGSTPAPAAKQKMMVMEGLMDSADAAWLDGVLAEKAAAMGSITGGVALHGLSPAGPQAL